MAEIFALRAQCNHNARRGHISDGPVSLWDTLLLPRPRVSCSVGSSGPSSAATGLARRRLAGLPTPRPVYVAPGAVGRVRLTLWTVPHTRAVFPASRRAELLEGLPGG